MDKLAAMRIFAAVVDEGGFSAAARRLNLSKSTVSTIVRELEANLGVALLNRTTRRVSMTEAGTAYKQRCDQILADIEEAELEAAEQTLNPRGTLKLSVGLSFGMIAVAPALAPFMAAFPDISIDLLLSDRIVDLVDEGVDLAIRIGFLEDSSLMTRKLATTRRIVCAAPAYLDRHGRPDKPEDLRRHHCLIYTLLASGGAWSFQRGGKPFSIPLKGRLAANNGDVLARAAVDGLGICFTPTFLVADALRAGQLVPLLEDFELPPLGIHAVYPANRHVSAKVRAFIDFLVLHFGDPAPWDLYCS